MFLPIDGFPDAHPVVYVAGKGVYFFLGSCFPTEKILYDLEIIWYSNLYVFKHTPSVAG
jgi:hypothetical protein